MLTIRIEEIDNGFLAIARSTRGALRAKPARRYLGERATESAIADFTASVLQRLAKEGLLSEPNFREEWLSIARQEGDGLFRERPEKPLAPAASRLKSGRIMSIERLDGGGRTILKTDAEAQ